MVENPSRQDVLSKALSFYLNPMVSRAKTDCRLKEEVNSFICSVQNPALQGFNTLSSIALLQFDWISALHYLNHAITPKFLVVLYLYFNCLTARIPFPRYRRLIVHSHRSSTCSIGNRHTVMRNSTVGSLRG